MVTPILSEMNFETHAGLMKIDIFNVAGEEVIVLRTENIPGAMMHPVCRIQSECCSHIFGDQVCDCQEQIFWSLKAIKDTNCGLLIFLRQEGMSLGLSGKLEGINKDWRNYNAAIAVLKYYEIKTVDLISLDIKKTNALIKAGITVKKNSWHMGRTVILGKQLEHTVNRIKLGLSYSLFDKHLRCLQAVEKSKMLSIGDLNIDKFYNKNKSEEPHISVGGSGYNAAKAFSGDYNTIIFGKIGNDHNGSLIRHELEHTNLWTAIGEHPNKKTGLVEIIETEEVSVPRHYNWDKSNNANDYDVAQLKQTLAMFDIGTKDFIFITTYMFVQKGFSLKQIREFIEVASASGANIIIDIARKSLSRSVLSEFDQESFTKETLLELLQDVKPYVVIVEIQTLEALGFKTYNCRNPSKEMLKEWLGDFRTRNIICRFTESGKFKQKIGVLNGDTIFILPSEDESQNTRFTVGKGDVLSVKALANIMEFEKTNR